MKANLRRKLVMSIGAAVMTTCCLTTSTYAWFAKNANAWVEDFELKVHTDEGLSISIDGVHYVDSIDKNMLLRAIATYRYNLTHEYKDLVVATDLTDEQVAEYSKTALVPVVVDDNMDFYGYNQVNIDANPKYYIEDGYYKPENLTLAARNTQASKDKYIPTSYVAFDLYFRCIPSSNNPKDTYNLVLATSDTAEGLGVSYIKADDSTVRLSNSLEIPTGKTTDKHKSSHFISTEEITINPANAMRLAFTGISRNSDGIKVVYEPNEGYGSYALNNIPDGAISDDKADLYNPSLNPMVTYFNNTHNLGKLSLPDYDAKYVNTEKDFEGKLQLGEFYKKDGKYTDTRVTCYLWLDGYDADYIEGVDTSSVHFFLNFTKEAV